MLRQYKITVEERKEEAEMGTLSALVNLVTIGRFSAPLIKEELGIIILESNKFQIVTLDHIEKFTGTYFECQRYLQDQIRNNNHA